MPEDKNNVEDVQDVQTDNTEPKAYTAEELKKLIDSEADRRTASAQKKWKEKTQKQLEQTEKLAKMDEEQRFQYELDTTKAELAQMKLDKAKAENTQGTLRVLANRELSADLLDFVLTEDAESTLENIDSIQKVIKKMVDAEVSRRIPTQGTPKSGNKSGKITKEEFAKWSLAKQAQLATNNPEQYKELIK